MTSEELANEVEQAVRATRSRILGTGNEQYGQGENQQFESMTMDELMQYMLEEIDDTICYAVMQRIRIRRLFDVLKHAA